MNVLRRAGRRWYRSMGWVLILTFIITLAAGIYMHFYEPERCVAEYTLCAVPEPEGQKPAPLSMWMLLRDINRLLDEDSFRQQVISQTPSDGKTFVKQKSFAAESRDDVKYGVRQKTLQLDKTVADTLKIKLELAPARIPGAIEKGEMGKIYSRDKNLNKLPWQKANFMLAEVELWKKQ